MYFIIVEMWNELQVGYGEVFEVDDKMLKHIDELEDHPTLYLRCTCECLLLEDKMEDDQSLNRTKDMRLACEVYVLPGYKEHLLTLPHISHYSSSAEGGKKYAWKIDSDACDYNIVDEVKAK